MIHTGPIHIPAHNDEDGCDCDPYCEMTEPRTYPNLHAMLVEGWWWECDECQQRTDREEDDDGAYVETNPVCTVYRDSNEIDLIFCMPECHDLFMANMRKKKADREALIADIARAWPDSKVASLWHGKSGEAMDKPHQHFATIDAGQGLQIRVWQDGEIRCFAVGVPVEAVKARADKAKADWGARNAKDR
jgi:hypothetical protein